jgi:hypothetical protein
MLPVIAADLILNADGKGQINEGFGLGQTFDAIYQGARSRITCELSSEDAEKLDEFIEKLVAFSGNAPHRSLDHWLSLLRILDGKRLIRWLRQEYRLGDRDIRWHLARLTRDREKIPVMLDQAVLDLTA